jgi:hypothetical protein
MPAQNYGAAPGAYGAAPAGYGPAAGAMVAAGAGAMQGYAPPGQPVGTRGTMRNPVMTLVLGYVTCGIYAAFAVYSMLKELRNYLGKDEIVPWHIFIPFWNYVVFLAKLPNWVTEAKQRAGSRNPQSAGPVLYFFLGLYFLPKDLNEVWDPAGTSGG